MQATQRMSDAHLVLLARGEVLREISDGAEAMFPSLRAGGALPGALLPPEGEECWEGCVVLEGRGWRVSTRAQGEDTQYLLMPMEQSALTQGQLDGALYQLRALMTRMRQESGPYISGRKQLVTEQDRAEFSRDYYRMLRLMDHLDLLRDAADGQLRADQQSFEMGEVAWRTAVECDGLLGEIGVSVVYQGLPGDLIVWGTPCLLRDALMELISNSARRLKEGGTVTVKLTKRGDRALLLVTDSGPAATTRQQTAMTVRGGLPRIPVGDMGAGLGLSVAEEIVRAHGGALFIAAGEGAPRVWLSLPLGGRVLHDDLTCHTPERNAGMSPYLIALSDILPGRVILEDWIE